MIIINGKFLTQKLSGVQRFSYEMSYRLLEKLENCYLAVPSRAKIPAGIPSDKVLRIGRLSGIAWEQLELPIYLYLKFKGVLLLNLGNMAPVLYKNKIVTLHDIAFIRFPEAYSKGFRLYYRMMIPIILKNSRKILTVSNFSKKEIINFYKMNPSNIDVIYNAVSDSFYRMRNDHPGKGPKYFLMVGSVQPQKNIDLVIKTFKKFSYKDIHLKIVGGYNPNVFQEIKWAENDLKKENIEYLGFVSDEDLVDLYKNAIALIFPSLYEGFGLPPLEAMAMGTPVIASNQASIPEVLGDAALYFDPHSKDDLLKNMIRIYEDVDLRKKLIDRGFKRVKEFSWEKSVNKLISILINEGYLK